MRAGQVSVLVVALALPGVIIAAWALALLGLESRVATAQRMAGTVALAEAVEHRAVRQASVSLPPVVLQPPWRPSAVPITVRADAVAVPIEDADGRPGAVLRP